MKWTNRLLLLLLLTLVSPVLIHAAVVKDPFAHYLATTAYSPDDQVLSFVADFDERQEYVFISLSSLVAGREGNTWEVYRHENNRYKLLNITIPPLRRDMLAFTNVDGVQGRALVTFLPDNPEEGYFQTIQLSGNEMTTHVLGKIEFQGKDKELYSELFSSGNSKVVILERPVAEVLAASAPETDPVEKPGQGVRRENPVHTDPGHGDRSPAIDHSSPASPPMATEIYSASPQKGWRSYAVVALVAVFLMWIGFSKYRSR